MAIKKSELEEFREELSSARKPLFFYDDDPDGLSSFLLVYRFVKDGKGIVVKSKPVLDQMFSKIVYEFSPDKVFVLDIPMISDEFLQKVKTPIVWLDHHSVQEKRGTKYFNPRINDEDDNRPTSYWCWKALEKDLPDDIWIAMVGCIGDWFLPEFASDFCRLYPDLLSGNISKPEDALFNSELGRLIRLFSFALKGRTNDVNMDVKLLTRVKSPYELLKQLTPAGRKVYNRFLKMDNKYERLKQNALSNVKKGKILHFIYNSDETSFTSDLSNELLYLYPDKLIVIGREKSGEVKYSIRSSYLDIPSILNEIFKQIGGYGGGHKHACGACVNSNDKETFLKLLES